MLLFIGNPKILPQQTDSQPPNSEGRQFIFPEEMTPSHGLVTISGTAPMI